MQEAFKFKREGISKKLYFSDYKNFMFQASCLAMLELSDLGGLGIRLERKK
jgi:hypothetical protein